MTACIEITRGLALGQRVRHREKSGRLRVGRVMGAQVSPDGTVEFDVGLDEPIVIPPFPPVEHETKIWRQTYRLNEIEPYFEEGELIESLKQTILALLSHAPMTTSDGFGAAIRGARESLRAIEAWEQRVAGAASDGSS